MRAVLRHAVRQLLIYVVLSFVAKWHATLHPMREDKGRQKSEFLERERGEGEGYPKFRCTCQWEGANDKHRERER